MPLEGKYQFQVFAFSTVVQEPIITDFLETGGKHMHQITADEFRVIQSDGAPWIARLFSSGRKDSLLFINGKNSAVGNSNLMCISSQIFHGVAKTVEGLFYVWAPVFQVKAVTEFRPVIGVTQFFAGRRKTEFLGFIKFIESREIFPFKLVTEYPDRDKKAPGRFSYFMVLCQPATGDNTVHMHVVINLLVPGMEDLDDPGSCPEILLVRRQLKKCLGAAPVKESVKQFLVTVDQRIKLMRK